MTENILEVKGLVKDYGDFALDHLSFELPRGAIMGLIGENGSGKSTTIGCILGELQRDDGEILLFGKDLPKDEVAAKDRTSVVSDERLLPDIFTPLEMGVFIAGIYRRWDDAAYRSYLERFGLPQDKEVKDFS